jgi:NADP-dependent aldehyde dehydrogenase
MASTRAGEVVGIDPRTGRTVEVVAPETTTQEVTALCEAALAAAPVLDAFCTNPSLVFVPTGADGAAVVDAMAEAVRGSGAQVLLNEGITDSYGRIPGGLADEVLARYDGEDELFATLQAMPSSLTPTLLRDQGEADLPLAVSQQLRPRAGRLAYDAYPTGVVVPWAQHHGGPWPSTNSQHTSVGTSAIRRFVRPVTWQGAPQEVLPVELTDGYASIPWRIDGALRMPRG